MYLLPAIDILDGRVVRLARGSYDDVKVYNESPLAQAQEFEQAGAKWVHIVDLDGAKTGKPQNIDVVHRIVAQTNLNVEVGGGIRNLETLKYLADANVTRMVLGTALVNDPELATCAIETVGADALVAGIDARNGVVAVNGWVEGTSVKAEELASEMGNAGFKHIVYTDITRDGMQTGVDTAAYTSMAHAFGSPVIVSGGVASVEDINIFAPCVGNIEGIIAGRAIYEGRLSVAEGVAACFRTTNYDQNPS